jgi:hypothetical protein
MFLSWSVVLPLTFAWYIWQPYNQDPDLSHIHFITSFQNEREYVKQVENLELYKNWSFDATKPKTNLDAYIFLRKKMDNFICHYRCCTRLCQRRVLYWYLILIQNFKRIFYYFFNPTIYIAIQFLMKMNEGRIRCHTCKDFVLLLLSKDQMCTHD